MARLTDRQDNNNGSNASSRKANSPASSNNDVQSLHDIPKFDLAEQIMAEQRKISAVRRKGPGKRTKTKKPQKVEASIPRVEEPLIHSEQDKIIAEIVTRDINNLLKGNQEDG